MTTDLKLRADIRAITDTFFNAWSTGEWNTLASSLTDNAILMSGQHGEAKGLKAWQDLLAKDTNLLTWMHTSNHATVLDENKAVASAYVIGLFEQSGRQFLFGGSLTLRYTVSVHGEVQLDEVRIQANWTKGDTKLAKHWCYLPTDQGWNLGDPSPTIVSELDAPWNLIRNEVKQTTTQEAVAQLYSKYSWAIDQGDIALLSDCYTEDAAGGFTPMGRLQGRHAIIGQQKGFRRHWPWMQHFADVLRIEVEDNDQYASMIVGRMIPERPYDEQGNKIYGAHYQLRARLEDDGKWRICWFDYRPGWFNQNTIPEFEIGVTHA